MSSGQWDQIQFDKLPAKASKKYVSDFRRHCDERYQEFLDNLKSGEKTVKSTGIQSHEIVANILDTENTDEVTVLESQWFDLKNRLKANLRNVVPMIDVFGSMEGGDPSPKLISMALGLLVAECNGDNNQRERDKTWEYKALTFSKSPEIHKICGSTLKEKFENINNMYWNGGNTDIYLAFDRLLEANDDGYPLPTTLVVFSDMEFDANTHGEDNETAYENLCQKFRKRKLMPPSIVFWNLRYSCEAIPVSSTCPGVTMLSGYSADLLQFFLEDFNEMSPIKMLKRILSIYPEFTIID